MRVARWNDGAFGVTSYGNGLAYAVSGPDDRSYFVQGDSASDWRAEYDAADAAGRLDEFHADYMAAIGELESA